jgi:hypothetical protein
VPAVQIRITTRRALIGVAILLLAATGLAALAWRQEVGRRASPVPSAIPPEAKTGVHSVSQRRGEKEIAEVWVPPGWYRRGSDPA